MIIRAHIPLKSSTKASGFFTMFDTPKSESGFNVTWSRSHFMPVSLTLASPSSDTKERVRPKKLLSKHSATNGYLDETSSRRKAKGALLTMQI